MKRYWRRLLYLVAVLGWLALMSLPVFAFVLANRGQVSLGSETGTGVRVFLLQGTESEGIGFQLSRPLNEAGPDCTRTSLYYFIWEGESQPGGVSYCQCHDRESGFASPLPNCQLD
ncbi:MAG: hypothetical protein R3300_08290 [Candidatus Promineifilaceae bacterium]|nr:hypothetical protein [Candidatus Promineifilaceae bacterium]